ncbi:MAG: hypothetical protein ACI9GM_001166, partial [Salibacteraceae bacterium]
ALNSLQKKRKVNFAVLGAIITFEIVFLMDPMSFFELVYFW